MPKVTDLINPKTEDEITDLLSKGGSPFLASQTFLEPKLDVGKDGLQAQAISPENFVCLKGPCKHYAEVLVKYDAGNIDREFFQVRRYCKALSANNELMELTDGNIYRCSLHEKQVKKPLAVAFIVVILALGIGIGTGLVILGG